VPKKKRKTEEVVIGHRKTKIEYREIENPYFQKDHSESNSNPKKILAAVNMRESVSAHWLIRNKIDLAEYKASTDIRRWYETLGGKGAGAIDYSKPYVDGGGSRDPINLREMEAAMRLRDVHSVVGQRGWEILEILCCQCVPINKAYPDQYERRKKSELCRHMLTRLAEYLGYRSTKIRAHRG
jgi:hypothetical protein